MAGSVSRLPNGTTDHGDRLPPADLYKAAVDEYRFQAQFNWSRTQYMLVFNTGILAAATAVASRPGRSAALVFLLGVIAASASALIVKTQHGYYRAARDRMRRVEAALEIPDDQRTDSTSTLGGRKRTVSVNQLVYLLLGALAVADAVGAAIIFVR
jgi:hypothetical protein